jgi:hypothetical protein
MVLDIHSTIYISVLLTVMLGERMYWEARFYMAGSRSGMRFLTLGHGI